jgi:NH(3)-dependent NAD(+) synthetase
MKKWENIFNTMVYSTLQYLNDYGINNMILGISGGIDSTLVAAICHEVVKRSDGKKKLLGYSLMCSTNQSDEVKVAEMVGKSLCTEYQSINLEEDYKTISSSLSNHFKVDSPIANGNIKARLRMLYLYHCASIYNGIVMDTDNYSEHQLGFWTLHGDEGDFNPIGNLYKTEIYELCEWLCTEYYINDKDIRQAIEESYKLTPTDGNGVKMGGDMAQIAPGLTYKEVDRILSVIQVFGYSKNNDVILKILSEEKWYDEDIVKNVINRVKNNSFKRKHRPLKIDLGTGEITQQICKEE